MWMVTVCYTLVVYHCHCYQVPSFATELFPDDGCFCSNTIRQTYKCLWVTRKFASGKRKWSSPVTSTENEVVIKVQEEATRDAQISIYRLSWEIGSPVGSAWNILHKSKYWPYHVNPHQALCLKILKTSGFVRHVSGHGQQLSGLHGKSASVWRSPLFEEYRSKHSQCLLLECHEPTLGTTYMISTPVVV